MYDLDDDLDDLDDLDNLDDLDDDLDESSRGLPRALAPSRVDSSPRWIRAVRELPGPPGSSLEAI